MTDAAQLLKLMSWLSPVFPTGGFAYSSGLEQAAAQAIIRDKVALEDWIAAQLAHGGSWNDAVLLMEAHRRVSGSNRACELAALAELATALPTSQQRLNETCDQGTSFLKAAAHWIDGGQLPGRDTPLPVAIGAVAGLERIDPRLAVAAYLHAYVSNQLQCAIRLSLTGQDGAAELLSWLEPRIAICAERAVAATLDDLGGAAFIADIVAMTHETLEPRLFLS